MALAAVAVIAAAGLASGARADVPRAAIEGVADDDLRGRLERAVGEVERAPESRFEARRRAREAAERATALLRSEGYYGAVVDADVSADEPPRAIVRVDPGDQFVVAGPAIEWLDPPATERSKQAAFEALDLEERQPGRAAEVIAAEGRAVALLQSRGYADARADERRVIVDHATKTVQPTYRLNSGDLVRLDGLDLAIQGRTDPQWIAGLAPWRPGAVYSPEAVAELERRLFDTGVYDSVTVALAPPAQTTAEGRRPVIVSLSERPRQVLEAGVGWSTSEGFGFDGEWTFHNRWRRADTLRALVRLAEIEQRAGVELSLPHWRRPGRTLTLGTQLFNERTDAYDRFGLDARFELRQRLGKTSWVTYGGRVDLTRNNEKLLDEQRRLLVGEERDLIVAALFAGASLDRSDDPLDPKTGYRLLTRAEPTLVAGDDNLAFLKLDSQVSAYLPLQDGGKTVAAGRVRVGSIVGGDIPGVPTALRFFSGGGGSVRGYEYQGIGPRLADGTPTGGLSVVETSIEVRRDIGERWGAAVFVDAGTVGEDAAPSFEEARVAVGAGVRYRLPFGPVRADVAFPLNRDDGQPAFQVYVSIGQAF